MVVKTKNNPTNNFSIIRGNLFEFIEPRIRSGNNGSSVIVPHVCNNIDLFGAGFAAAVSKHYPIVKENYHLLGKNFLKNNLGYVQYVKVLEDKNYGHNLIFANMIAQNSTISKSNPRPLNYRYLGCNVAHRRSAHTAQHHNRRSCNRADHYRHTF